MTMTERSTVVGVFTERVQAEQALEELRHAGFNEDQIGFLARGEDSSAPQKAWAMPAISPLSLTNGANASPTGMMAANPGMVTPMIEDEGTVATDASSIHESGTVAGAATGAVGGGVIGGLVGAAVALLIPGLGPAIAGGILAATLGGVALGAVAGGFIGAMTGMGISEDDARYYQDELSSGRSIVTVHTPNRYEDAVSILRRNGAYDATTRAYTTEVGETVPEPQAAEQTHPSAAPTAVDPNPDHFAVAPSPSTMDHYGTTPDGVRPDARTYDPSTENQSSASRSEYNPNISGGTSL